MKKTLGRDRDYKKALVQNLVRSLEVNKKITTTRARARLLKSLTGTKLTGNVVLTPVEARRGDNAPQVVVELVQKDILVKKEKNENRSNTTVSNRKKVASR